VGHDRRTTATRTLATVSDSSTTVLDELLESELQYDATTTRGFTNHLPMALVAKAGLGAPIGELTRFADLYRRRLLPSHDVGERLTRTTWLSAVGTPAAYADLALYFDGEIDSQGVSETVRFHIPSLVDGVSGAAFHGVIRLAYALDAASPKRVGAGLAYLAAHATVLAPLDAGIATSDDPLELLRDLAAARDWSSAASAPNISEEMREVARHAEFQGVASSLAVDDATPRRLADVALALYATTDNFTALHGVTGLEALSKLRPYVDDVDRFDRASFQALAAAYLTIGGPPLWSSDRLDEWARSAVLDRATVEERASLSNDEHVAKLVFTAKRLNALTQNPLYFAIAERAVKGDETREDLSPMIVNN
jgi:hypothetical protein